MQKLEETHDTPLRNAGNWFVLEGSVSDFQLLPFQLIAKPRKADVLLGLVLGSIPTAIQKLEEAHETLKRMAPAMRGIA
jgi:hypothetical protein